MLGVKIGIDFGSTNITLCEDDKGIVICEPSVVICDSYTGKPIAVGNAARKMISNNKPFALRHDALFAARKLEKGKRNEDSSRI